MNEHVAGEDLAGLDLTGATLAGANLTGTFVSGSSLRFGTTGGGLTPGQLALITAEGRKVAVDLNFSVACSASGGLKTAVINVRDLSQLHQVNHIRSVLLASVSHELQTPISIIKAYANTMARPDAKWSEEMVREKLRAIEEESDRLSRPSA